MRVIEMTLINRGEIRKSFLLCTFLLLCLVCPGVAVGQNATTGSINGTVVDSGGAVVPGASITLTDLATREQRVVISNGEGRFTAPFLKPDNFEVSATGEGLQSSKTTVQVLTGQQSAERHQPDGGGEREQCATH